MFDAPVWPAKILMPSKITPSVVPFSRSGGRALNGQERVTRTDRGFWAIAYEEITLYEVSQRRSWNALRTMLSGRAGLIAIPVWSSDSAPWPGADRTYVTVPHSDGASFSDGANYRQRTIDIKMAEAAAIGATAVTIRVVSGADDMTGIRFSYRHALYETGPAINIDGDEWQVTVFPALRAAIPEGADLECDLPTCLCHLASDRAMDVQVSAAHIDRASVSFVEAVDYWNDAALAA